MLTVLQPLIHPDLTVHSMAAGCRGAYQRATQVPCTGLDQLWRAYEVFEQQGSSRALARRVLEQQRPRYQAARTALGPRTRHQEALNHTALPFPPGEPQPQGSSLLLSLGGA